MGFADTFELRRFAGDKFQKVSVFETPDMFCDVYCLEAGQAQKRHSHDAATKFYFVIEGEGVFAVADKVSTLGRGGIAWALPGEAHSVENRSSSRLVLLVAMGPNPNLR